MSLENKINTLKQLLGKPKVVFRLVKEISVDTNPIPDENVFGLDQWINSIRIGSSNRHRN